MAYCLKLSPDFKLHLAALKFKNLIFIRYKKSSISSCWTTLTPDESFNSVWYSVYILDAVLLISKFILLLVNPSL